MDRPDTDQKDYVVAPAPNEQVLGPGRDKPPRARVSDAPLKDEEAAGDKLARKKDYLEGFLAQKPTVPTAGEVGGELYEMVIDALKDIYDPEIPVNIYDLGLIYGVDVSSEADVAVTMTLTTPHCPVAESMPAEIELRISSIQGVRDAQVNVTWDPPWDPSKMSDEARLELGML